MTTDTATFTLSQEEVYYLLSQVRARGLLGVDSAPLAAFDAEQRRAVLDAAARALYARGLIVRGDDGQIVLDAAVRAALHAAAFAPVSLSTITRRPGASQLETYILHHADPIWVEHTQPEPGLHQFALSPAPPAVRARLEQMLAVADQPAPAATPFVIDQAELEQIEAAATSPSHALQAAIIGAGADQPSAERFAELLVGPRTSAIMQAINRRGPEEQTHTVTFLSNQHGFWILEAIDPTRLNCRPAGADVVRDTIGDLIDRL